MKKKPVLKGPAKKRPPLNVTAKGAAEAAARDVRRNVIKAQMQRETAKSKLLGQFPEATEADLANASKPGEVVEYSHYVHGQKRTVTRDPAPKDQFFRTPKEGRAKNVMPKLTKVKLRKELWNGKTVLDFFRGNRIHATKGTNGWKLFIKSAGVMTAAEQLELMLAYKDTEFIVEINYNAKHIMFEDTKGEEQ